jgi:hypothetical protein
MQLFILATILSSVISQQGIVRTDGWSLDMRRFNECVRVNGRANSAYTSQGVEIQLFEGPECGRGPYYYTYGGNYNLPRPYNFQSAWIVRTNRSNLKSDAQSDAPQASATEGFGGEESGSSSNLEARSYYSP